VKRTKRASGKRGGDPWEMCPPSYFFLCFFWRERGEEWALTVEREKKGGPRRNSSILCEGGKKKRGGEGLEKRYGLTEGKGRGGGGGVPLL